MRITEIIKRGDPVFSLEFFPPKTPEEMTQLYATLRDLNTLHPGYISVTYGAGGGTRDKTIEIVTKAKHEIGLESMAHLTCVANSRQQIKDTLDELVRSGIDNVAALRGDPPKGTTQFAPHQDGFQYASELTAFIRKSYPLCIAVAGYPEGHIESPNKETDWNHLEEKVRVGADFIITQLFFDNRYFFLFEKRMREKGVSIPIIPGIMPITNYQQIVRFTKVCGASIPQQLVRDLEAIQHDPNAVQAYGTEYAVRQCRELMDHGVPGLHFYTLNRSKATHEIIRRLKG
jgi:methylenetetrahydrofolate reductase (NADPH)